MPLFGGEVKREFIARPDSSKQEILYKWPDQNIRKWSQLTVQADEMAVFFRDGLVQGTVAPGRSTLDSSEIPFLGKLVDAATGGDVFKTEIYFVSTREFPNLPFGGMIDNVADPETGLLIGLQVYGDYSLKIVEPQSLIVNLVGTQGLTSNEQITNWMRDQLLKVLRTDVVAHITQSGWSILGLAAHNDDIEQATIANVTTHVQTYGVQIVRMGNFTINITDDDRAKLGKFKEQQAYTKLAGGFQQAAAGEALLGVGEGAAQGGGALPSALLGIGLGMGQNMMQGQTMAAGNQVQVRCAQCNALNPESARFCAGCGGSLAAPAAAPTGAVTHCTACGTGNAATASFCAHCGASMTGGQAPPSAPTPPTAPPTPPAAPPAAGDEPPQPS